MKSETPATALVAPPPWGGGGGPAPRKRRDGWGPCHLNLSPKNQPAPAYFTMPLRAALLSRPERSSRACSSA
jgi:hypothetical protein